MKAVLLILCAASLCAFAASPSSDVGWIDIAASQSIQVSISKIVTDNNGNVFVATNGQGIYYTTNSGTRWYNTNIDATNSNGDVVGLLAHPNGYLYAGTSNGFLFRSKTKAKTWEVLSESDNSDPSIRDIVCDRDGNIYVAYGSGEIEMVDANGVLKSLINAPEAAIRTIAIDKNKALYVATMTEGLYKTTNFGSGWQRISTSIGNNVQTLAIDAEGIVYVGLGGSSGVFRSLDGGAAWTQIGAMLGPKGILSIQIVRDSHLLVGTRQGVYYSSNRGSEWSDINGGTISTSSIGAIGLDSRNYLYVGTTSGKVFRSREFFFNPNAIADAKSLRSLNASVYPNPVANDATITLTLERYAPVNVVLFDALGREVARESFNALSSGVHQLPIATRSLPTGMYFASIKAGAAERTSMMLVKR